MKLIFYTFIILLPSLNIQAQSKISEKNYSLYIQSLISGEREVSIQNGRIDLVTSEYAIEIEKAKNWKESIGQSLWYALNTNKKPAIILILETESDYKHLIQLQTTIDYGKLTEAITVFAFPNDFKELIEKKKTDNKR